MLAANAGVVVRREIFPSHRQNPLATTNLVAREPVELDALGSDNRRGACGAAERRHD